MLGVKDGIEVLGELLRSDAHHRLAFGDHAFIDQVHCNPHGRDARALPDPGLEHVQLAFLDRELQVEHVAVVTLELLIGLHEVLVGLRERLRQGLDRQRRADAGDHVLSLGVQQTLAEEVRESRARVSCEGHAGSARLSQVAKHHRHHVHRRAPGIRNVIEPPVGDRARPVPGIEHRIDSHLELLVRIVRKLVPGLLLHNPLVVCDQALQRRSREIGVMNRARLGLLLFQNLLEPLALEVHHDRREHRNESPVGVVGKPLVVRLADEPLDGPVVEPQVQHRVHHAGHGGPRA